MVRYVWWTEHTRLCASGVLTSVRAHFKGLGDRPIEVRSRYRYAAKIAEIGLAKNMQNYRPKSECPECGQNTHYFSDQETSHAWFDTISPSKWRTHTCMSIAETKCSPEWKNSPAGIKYDKDMEEQKKSVQQEAEALKKRDIAILERRSKLSAIQLECGIKANSNCPTCNDKVYSFQTRSGLKKLYDSMHPYWQVHECFAQDDKPQATLRKPIAAKNKAAQLPHKIGDKRILVLKKRRRVLPLRVTYNTDISESDRQYVLCRLMAVTPYQNGHRLRLNPVPLPKVDMVVFCEVDALDIEGVQFVYLNDTDMSFLSQKSLRPVKTEVNYVTVRMM